MKECFEMQILEQYNRLVRNVAKNTIHVSSIHKLTAEEVESVVKVGSEMTDLTNVGLLKSLAEERIETLKEIPKVKYIHPLLYATLNTLATDFFKANGGYDRNSPVQYFLVATAGTSANQACINLGLIRGAGKDDPFERNHGELETNGKLFTIKGVCAAPNFGREWVNAAEITAVDMRTKIEALTNKN